MRLAGVLLPVTTPFDARGEVDLEALGRNIRAWAGQGVDGFVVAGSTGEAPLLDDVEIAALTERARERADGLAVVTGTGAESTRRTIRLSVAAAAAGAQAVLVRPPAYYAGSMTREALRLHYLEVADASPVPVVLYHIPKFVPVPLEPELVGELVSHPNIAGIKDSSGDVHNLGALCEACGDRAAVLVGAGTHLYSGLEIGAAGGIVAVGLLAAADCARLYEAWRDGRAAEAGRLQERIGPLHKRVVAGAGIPGIKHGLDLLGLAGGPSRAPLVTPTPRVRADVAEALAAAGLTARDPDSGG
ncbi:MAG: dihydrodipicolinate synthase family protein [Gemmatimonadota bacterium]|nr:dihydrodipicolinate synthase family protein [Gemmatimonadota bacterium]